MDRSSVKERPDLHCPGPHPIKIVIGGKKATCTEFVGRKTRYFSRVDRESCVCYTAEARNVSVVKESEREDYVYSRAAGKEGSFSQKQGFPYFIGLGFYPVPPFVSLSKDLGLGFLFLSPFFHGRSQSLICRDEDGIDRSSGIFSITTHLYPLFDRFLRSRAWKSRVCTFFVREWMRFGRGPSKRLLTAKPTAPPLDL